MVLLALSWRVRQMVAARRQNRSSVSFCFAFLPQSWLPQILITPDTA
ncbi:hypothetical protein Z949_1134 [Sulfitobacter guttiformis KCTC 32187]|nr:hypothetical protein Z949_1134 [Sulfitobacter guttiformis KCTC 32187]